MRGEATITLPSEASYSDAVGEDSLRLARLDRGSRSIRRRKGTGELVAQALPDNRAVLALAARHRFRRPRLPEDDVVELRLNL